MSQALSQSTAPAAPQQSAADRGSAEAVDDPGVLQWQVAQTLQEIASLRQKGADGDRLSDAGLELNAIIVAAEAATDAILSAAETLETSMDQVAAASPDPAVAEHLDSMRDAVARIYEASNFQDITGQRITKVVTALKQVEDKVDTLLAAFGEDAAAARRERAAAPKKQVSADDDASLMNGPSSPGEAAVSQDDIDALLASFD